MVVALLEVWKDNRIDNIPVSGIQHSYLNSRFDLSWIRPAKISGTGHLQLIDFSGSALCGFNPAFLLLGSIYVDQNNPRNKVLNFHGIFLFFSFFFFQGAAHEFAWYCRRYSKVTWHYQGKKGHLHFIIPYCTTREISAEIASRNWNDLWIGPQWAWAKLLELTRAWKVCLLWNWCAWYPFQKEAEEDKKH